MIEKLCRLILKLTGWTLEFNIPDTRRYVLIGYPHTSNWDFILAMLAKGALQFRFRWVAKHSLFKWPLGSLMIALGGIPVDRTQRTGFIDQLAERYASEPEMVIVITPEGTRAHTQHWKSGFYHLAQKAQVPVALGYLDFPNKRLGIGPLIELSGDESADMARIADFYADKVGLHPDLAGPICLPQRSPSNAAKVSDASVRQS